MRIAIHLVAVLLFITLLAPGVALADGDEGERAFQAGDLERAKAVWTETAAKGDRHAQYRLGRILLAEGDARGWPMLQKSARAGYLPAQYRLADMSLSSQFAKADFKRTVRLYERVVNQPEPMRRAHPVETAEAEWALSNFYMYGIGVTANPRRGFELLRRAANAGHARAQVYMGLHLGGRVRGLGIQPDLVEAHKWLVLAWKQDADQEPTGNRPGHPRNHALEVRKRLSRAQFDRSKKLIRAWLDAKDAGTLGHMWEIEKRRSAAEKRLRRDEDMRGEVATAVIEPLAKKPCEDYFIRTYARAKGSEPGASRWSETWTVDRCGSPVTVRVSFWREGATTRWRVNPSQ